MFEEYKGYLDFIPGVISPKERKKDDLWFVFCQGRLLIKEIEGEIHIPKFRDIEVFLGDFTSTHYIGELEDTTCYCGEICNERVIENTEYFKLSELRPLINKLGYRLFMLAGRAVQIINWHNTHKYCGRCGSINENREDERAKLCPNCGLIQYPRISPAIIVAVVKDKKLLLAHNKNFIGNMYSVIAGFVEPGETFEECVKREVLEETGIKVKNIRYFASQPWPFPNSMMVAFTAEFAGGELKPDGIEIDDVNWFGADELPNVPSTGSVAGRLINWFRENYK